MARTLLALAAGLGLAFSSFAQQTSAGGNALAGARSRYLRDAAASQVAWRPWGQAAFDVARKSGRPIFLSIGYASSYDCHRLHREGFGNSAIAESLNGYTVPVLVDRFEHPEVAEAFDTIQRAMTGAATIPSSFALTPALEPYAAIGPAAPGDLGVFVATSVSRWGNSRDAVVGEGKANLAKARALGEPRGPGDIDRTLLAAIAGALDVSSGEPMALSFAIHSEDKAVRALALDTLRRLARGERRDRIGGGFHRSATALEKLLPDQALLASAYLEAWQETHDPLFEEVVRTTLDYVIRDLHLDTSGFWAAQDSYSLVPGQGPEVVDGVFYRWSSAELTALTGRARSLDEPLEPEVAARLFEVRQKRPQPFRDFTEIAGWNGLTISVLARAGAALGEQRYRDAALTGVRAVVSKLWNEPKKALSHSTGVDGLAEDYAMLVQGLVDLFESTYDVKWLELAKTVQRRQDELFWDPAAGRYATGSSVPEALRGLLVESDDWTPSANAVSVLNLQRLVTLTGNDAWRARPTMILQSFAGRLRAKAASSPRLAAALAGSFASPKIVVVTGDPRKKETAELLRSIHERWEPRREVVFVPEKGPARDRVTAALPFTSALAPDPERPRTYVCENGECRKM